MARWNVTHLFLSSCFVRDGRGGDEGLARTQSHPAGRRKGPFYKSFAGSGPTGFFLFISMPSPTAYTLKHIRRGQTLSFPTRTRLAASWKGPGVGTTSAPPSTAPCALRRSPKASTPRRGGLRRATPSGWRTDGFAKDRVRCTPARMSSRRR